MSKHMDYLKKYISLRRELKKADDEIKELKQEIREIEDKAIEAMIEEDVPGTKVRTENGVVTLSIQHKTHFSPSCKSGAFFKALIDLGEGDLVKTDVNTRSFGARMRELSEQAKESLADSPEDKRLLLPESIRDYVKVFEEDRLSVRGL